MLSGASDQFFTTNLNIANAAKLILDSDTLFRGAIARDVQSAGTDAGTYLRDVRIQASQYLKADDICGRAAIIGNIKDVILKKGSLTFITGGRSVGKSKIMKSIVWAIGEDQRPGDFKKVLPQTRVSIFMVNGRITQDLAAAMTDIATGKVAAWANRIVKCRLSPGPLVSLLGSI